MQAIEITEAPARLPRRFFAGLIDTIVPVSLIWWALLIANPFELGINWVFEPRRLVGVVLLAMMLFGWILVQWWAYGCRKAGFGYRLFGLQLVGVKTGQAIGWGRMCLHTLIYRVLQLSVLGWLALLLFLVIQEEHRGWHDLACRSLAIQPGVAKTQETEKETNSVILAGQSSFSPASQLMFGTNVNSRFAGTPAGVNDRNLSTSGQTTLSDPIQKVPKLLSGGQTLPSGQTQPVDFPSWQNPLVSSSNQISYGPYSQVLPGQTLYPSGAQQEAKPSDPYAQVKHLPQAPSRTNRKIGADHNQRRNGWRIQLDDGRIMEIMPEANFLIGRDPAVSTRSSHATIIQTGEGNGTVSKTHLLVGVDQKGVYVVDQNSTNGTELIREDKSLFICPPGSKITVAQNQSVAFGDRWFTVVGPLG